MSKVLKVLVYGAFGGGVATTCLTFMNYTEKRNVHAARATIPSDKSDLTSQYNYPPWDSNWDRRDPSTFMRVKSLEDESKSNEMVEVQKPTATRHIILIRHGQYNTKGDTDAECYLTALGRKQAEVTGLRLKELNLPYTHLVHSTMTRARETASLILPSLSPDMPVLTSDLLREGAPIMPEPPVKHWRPEKKVVKDLLAITGMAQHYFTDGARIEAAFRKYFHRADPTQKENSYEVIVCHANVIRYFICRAMQFPPEAWLRFSLHHCSLTWIALRPNGGVSTYLIGDCGHLNKELMTTS